MLFRKLVFLFILTLVAQWANCQISISGYIRDNKNGEALINALIMDTLNNRATVTNNFGYFTLNLPQKPTSIKVSYVGYHPVVLKISGAHDTAVTIYMELNTTLNEVVVNGNNRFVRNVHTGVESLTPKLVNSLPSIIGEPDILKTLTLLPGVSFGSEAASGYYVRGGSSDQNLLLIDGVPIYNPYHLHGYFSVFNTDAINQVNLYKGAVPASYGGRLSSVMDINMRQGNERKFAGSISMGTVIGKALIEGPLIKDKTTFLITARRSMIDLANKQVASLLNRFSGMSQIAQDINVPDYYFYDYNAKINHKFSDTDRLFINIYQSKDQFKNRSNEVMFNEQVFWENLSASARWNHVFKNNAFSNFTFYYTKYRYKSENSINPDEDPSHIQNQVSYETGIKDVSAKMDINHQIGKHILKYGGQYLFQRMEPSNSAFSQTTMGAAQSIDTTYFSRYNNHLVVFYTEDEIKILPKVTLNGGLHFSGYITDQKLYPSIQPRVSINYSPWSNFSVKGSFTRMVQPIHLLSTTWVGKPSDMWVPSTQAVKPENANQFALGANFTTGKFQLTAEAFWKNMHNLIDYKEGASYTANPGNWESQIESGNGKAYGYELSVKKEKGNLTGLLSYTYCHSIRNFENLNRGQDFPYSFDRRHSFSSALMYKFNNKFSIGANWIFATGQPVTLAETNLVHYFERENYFRQYSSINNARMPNYHRLDVSMNYTKKYTRFNYQINAGIYNAYNRKNAYSIFESTDGAVYINPLLGLLPYITLTIGFKSK
jgi:hypothetical protein